MAHMERRSKKRNYLHLGHSHIILSFLSLQYPLFQQ